MANSSEQRTSVGATLPNTIDIAAFLVGLGINNQTAGQKLISNGYISVAQLNSAPPSAADLETLGFNMFERNLILQILQPPTESSEIKKFEKKVYRVRTSSTRKGPSVTRKGPSVTRKGPSITRKGPRDQGL
eukprot:TRINITY_DN1273_c0_g2_i1.p2 TRINITY_DN1273_c0_g2~~TRINITY_DN1273_c0_g2_i1.p2  ORF type:complete len:132 (+),score=20.95 TRINITY_DN1273_c0_g2_i1:212-607(+)